MSNFDINFCANQLLLEYMFLRSNTWQLSRRKPILNFIVGIFWLFLTLYDWRIYLDSKREVIISKYIFDLISSLTIVEMSCSALFGFIDAIGDTPSRNFDSGGRVSLSVKQFKLYSKFLILKLFFLLKL